MTRYHVIYHGRVQGVGFRATTRSIAGRHPVTGFVRNRADGTAELEAQGESSAVTAFLDDIQRQFLGFVTDEDRSRVADLDGEAGFTVRY